MYVVQCDKGVRHWCSLQELVLGALRCIMYVIAYDTLGLHLTFFICFISSLIKEQVCVITCDGRSIFGILAGYDQLQNLILKEASERVYSPDADPESVPLGLYVIRGDNVAIISDRDEDLEASTGISSVRAEPLESVVQNVG